MLARALPLFFSHSLALVALARDASAAPSPFRFHVPAGWTDLSPGQPASSFEGLDPGLVAELRSSDRVAAALDARPDSPTFGALMLAGVEESPLRADDRTLARLAEDVAEGARRPEVREAVIAEKAIVSLGGVSALRLVLRVAGASFEEERFIYALPGGTWRATLVYAGTPAVMRAARPTLDAEAARTEGIAAPAPTSQWATTALIVLAFGAIAFVASRLGGGNKRRRSA